MPKMKLLTLLFPLILTSCHPLFCNWNRGFEQLKIKPNIEEVIGKYELDRRSKEFLFDRNYSAGKYYLTLLENGDFKFTNGPDMIFNSWGKSNQKLIDKEGKWSLSCAKSYNCMIELNGVFVEPLCQKDGEIAVLITIGDPDECNGIILSLIHI